MTYAEPDAFRTRVREDLRRAMQRVVVDDMTANEAVARFDMSEEDREQLARLVDHELLALNENNHARYALTFNQFDRWHKAQQPAEQRDTP